MEAELKVSIILDTGALLAKYYRLLPRHRVDIYTCSSNIEEVVDAENRQALEEALDLGIVKVVKPDRKFVEEALSRAREAGFLAKLSRTDIDVLALALQLRQKPGDVIVITDDYDLQNMLYILGLSFKPLRTRGIRFAVRFKSYCPTCGFVPSHPSETACPLCNSKIVHIPAKHSDKPGST